MKPKNALRNFLFTVGTSLLTVSFASAQLTWDPAGTGASDGAGAWLEEAKWWDGMASVDWSSGSAAIFGNGGAGGVVTLASPTTVSSLTLNAYTGTYTLGSADQELTLNEGITKNTGSGIATFVGPITLGGAQTWTNHSTTVLTTGNGTNLIDNGGFQLTVDGSGTTNFGVMNNAAVALTGAGNLVKNGSGRLNIGGVNSGFTGSVTINGNVLHVHNNPGALGEGNVTINDGVLSFYWSAAYTRTLGTGDSQVQILGGESGFAGAGTNGPTVNLGASVVWGALDEGSATGFFNPTKFVLGDSGTGNAGATTFSSAIDLNGATRTILVPAGNSTGLNRSTISGAISNSPEDTTAGLIKEGGGVLFLTTAPTYNGTTTVSAGRLDFGGVNLNSMGGGVGVRDITVAAGAVVRFNTLSNASLNRIVETSDEIGVWSGSTNNDMDFSSSAGANLPNAFLANWAGNGAKAQFGGVITPASDAYRFGFPGASGTMGVFSNLGGTQGLIVGGNVVQLTGNNTFSGDTVIRTGGRLFLGSNLCLQNSALNLGVGGDGIAGLLSLEGATGSGPIPGVERTDQPTLGGLMGSRNFASVISTGNANNTSRLPVGDILGLTLNPGPGKSPIYDGAITEMAPATFLTKTGEGTQTFNGTNTYTGATTVAGGTLALGASGSIATSASVILGAGGTLDTTAQATYAIPAGQPVTFGIDATSSGTIDADGLDITDAAVSFTGTPSASVYVLATYTSLTGAEFASVTLPSGYALEYNYNELNQIAIVSTGASAYGTWASINAPVGTPGDDFDGDGVSNAVEFVLGGDKDTNDLDKLPAVATSETEMTFVFVRDQDSVDAAVTLEIEVGTDLATWPNTYSVGADTGSSTAGVSVVDNGDGTDTITLTVAKVPDEKKFARLKVTVAE